MLETIFEWLTSCIGEVLEGLVNLFMGLLKMDVGSMAAQFPILAKGYSLFRTIGIGLAIVMASIAMVKFFMGDLSESADTPIQLLFRLAISLFLIYYGSYFLEWVVNIAKVPYDEILSWDAVHNPTAGEFFHTLSPDDLLKAFGALVVAPAVVPGVSTLLTMAAGPLLLLYAIVLLVIAWNVMKLLLEVFQRFIWLCVILFSAPLAFSTYVSKNTANIMMNWLKMFFSQCLLMVLSVWLLKAVVSGFSFDPDLENHNFIFQFLATMALCKVGSGIDREIQKLGLTATTAGGSLAESIRSDFKEVAGKNTIVGQASHAILGKYFSGMEVSEKDAKVPVVGSALQHGLSAIQSHFGVDDKSKKNQTSSDSTSDSTSSTSSRATSWKQVSKMGSEEEKSSFSKSVSLSSETANSSASLSKEARASHLSVKEDEVMGSVLKGDSAVVGMAMRNSIGRNDENSQATRVLRNTAQGMTTDVAQQTLTSRYGGSIEKGSDDATAGMLVRSALGPQMTSKFGIPSADPANPASKLSNVAVTANDKTGAVTTEYQFHSDKTEANGQLMKGKILNTAAYEAMPAKDKQNFTPIQSPKTGQTVGYAGVTEDYSEKSAAQHAMARGMSRSQHQEDVSWAANHSMEETFHTAYNDILPSGTKPEDIHGIRVEENPNTGAKTISADVYNRNTGSTERYSVVADEASMQKFEEMQSHRSNDSRTLSSDERSANRYSDERSTSRSSDERSSVRSSDRRTSQRTDERSLNSQEEFSDTRDSRNSSRYESNRSSRVDDTRSTSVEDSRTTRVDSRTTKAEEDARMRQSFEIVEGKRDADGNTTIPYLYQRTEATTRPSESSRRRAAKKVVVDEDEKPKRTFRI